MKLGPKRIIRPQQDYQPSDGDLATSTRFLEKKEGVEKSRWRVHGFHHCRDGFHDAFTNKAQNIIFCHPQNEREDIAAFVWKVEDRLKITEHTRIGPTQRNRYTWVKVAPFWLKSSMRRSFFTALLRAARSYHVAQNNFNTALYSVYYFEQTRPAVERFLDGFTHYTGREYGWHNVFKNKTKVQVESKLITPPEHPLEAEEVTA